MSAYVPGVSRALGEARIEALEALDPELHALCALTDEAWTSDVAIMALDGSAAASWDSHVRPGESWAWIRDDGRGKLLAIDEATLAAARNPAAGVVYVELQTQLTTWWLVHCWRLIDLVRDTIQSLSLWRISVSAVTARALIEEVASLVYEAEKLFAAWSLSKALPAGASRPQGVRNAIRPPLMAATFGSRIPGAPEAARATNVMTYVSKLIKLSGEVRIEGWYDWLTDAAHPAFGARVALSSNPMVHDSKATTVRYYSRTPVFIELEGEVAADFTIAHFAAEATAVCGKIGFLVLRQSLELVDDFQLTSGAALLTERIYWRKMAPIKGSRPCPCGRGSWASCKHFWEFAAPQLQVG